MIKILEASDNVACQAFARCGNAAEGACEHPVLGWYLSARAARRSWRRSWSLPRSTSGAA